MSNINQSLRCVQKWMFAVSVLLCQEGYCTYILGNNLKISFEFIFKCENASFLQLINSV